MMLSSSAGLAEAGAVVACWAQEVPALKMSAETKAAVYLTGRILFVVMVCMGFVFLTSLRLRSVGRSQSIGAGTRNIRATGTKKWEKKANGEEQGESSSPIV